MLSESKNGPVRNGGVLGLALHLVYDGHWQVCPAGLARQASGPVIRSRKFWMSMANSNV
jgi:hypothetical protein